MLFIKIKVYVAAIDQNTLHKKRKKREKSARLALRYICAYLIVA